MTFYGPYLLVKLVAYISWCYLGLRWFRPEHPKPAGEAVILGIGRLVLGMLLGIGIYLAALGMNNATRNAPLTYAAIYVPVRIVEWSVWFFVLRGRGPLPRIVLWIAGGVAISCLADFPIGIVEHGVVPVGRPLC